VAGIPQSTLQALLPVLAGIDPAKLTAQLKLLGQQDKETLDKVVFFLKAVSYCYCWCFCSCGALAKYRAVSPGQF
jgi:hypothetical protein